MKISVIIATYNRGHLIEEVLTSISQQNYSDWECIIIDDGSSDNTSDIIDKWCTRDFRFKYFKRTKNHQKGLSGSRNMGLEEATGDFIIFFDDDDFVHPKNFKTCLKYLVGSSHSFCRYSKKPFTGVLEKELLHCNLDKASGFKKIDRSLISEVITGNIAFASCCVMWKKECFYEKNLRFKEDLQYAEEWELYSRIILEGYEGVSIDQVLYFNRKHANSNTGEFQKMNPIRISSKIQASKYILQNLAKKYMTIELSRFFLRLGLSLKNLEIIDMTLQKSNSGSLTKAKYRLGFLFYPVLKPMFNLKKNFLKKFRF